MYFIIWDEAAASLLHSEMYKRAVNPPPKPVLILDEAQEGWEVVIHSVKIIK